MEWWNPTSTKELCLGFLLPSDAPHRNIGTRSQNSHLLSKHSESTGQLLSMWHLLHMGTSHQVWAVFVTESSRKHDEISGLGLRITSEHISAPPHQPNYLWQLPSKPEMMKRSLFMQKPSCARLGVSTRAFDSAWRVLSASCCLIWIISCKNVHVALLQQALGLCHGYWILRHCTRSLGCSRFTTKPASDYSQGSGIRIKCTQKHFQYNVSIVCFCQLFLLAQDQPQTPLDATAHRFSVLWFIGSPGEDPTQLQLQMLKPLLMARYGKWFKQRVHPGFGSSTRLPLWHQCDSGAVRASALSSGLAYLRAENCPNLVSMTWTLQQNLTLRQGTVLDDQIK